MLGVFVVGVNAVLRCWLFFIVVFFFCGCLVGFVVFVVGIGEFGIGVLSGYFGEFVVV